MRKTLLSLALLAAILSLNCNDSRERVLFDLVYVLPFSLPAGLNTVQTHFVEFPKVPTRYESLLAEHGLEDSQIGRIEPYSGILDIVLLPEKLSFCREVFVEFLDGTNRLECFYTPSVPLDTGNRLTLVGTIADFKGLLRESAMNLRIGFRLREPTPSALNYSIRLTFKAKA